jgi:hypothetical protein
MKKVLPILPVQLDEDKEFYIDAIALVDDPAIMSKFIQLNAHSRYAPERTFLKNEERRELLGAALIPDVLIYRRDPGTNEEYYITFDAATIRKAAQIFMKKGYQVNLNMQHTDRPANSFVYQSYIVDNERGMTSPAGLNLPSGSWVVGVKIDDPATWQDVQSGRANGFSVEGLFLLNAVRNTEKTDTFGEVINILSDIKNLLT